MIEILKYTDIPSYSSFIENNSRFLNVYASSSTVSEVVPFEYKLQLGNFIDEFFRNYLILISEDDSEYSLSTFSEKLKKIFINLREGTSFKENSKKDNILVYLENTFLGSIRILHINNFFKAIIYISSKGSPINNPEFADSEELKDPKYGFAFTEETFLNKIKEIFNKC